MYNCQRCRCFRKITELKVTGENVVLISKDDTVAPMEPFDWIIQTCYCSPAPTVPVSIVLNGTDVPLWDIYGRNVYSNQIRARTVYKARYVIEGAIPHLTVCNVNLEDPLCSRVPDAKVFRPQKGLASAKKEKE